MSEIPASKYLRYRRDFEKEAGIKTKVWSVISEQGNVPLGRIKWYSNWRQYAFFPSQGTIWNPDCLTEISDICRRLTTEHRAKWGH